jgi:Cdc6-like AAA superfamily ATPase
MTDQATWKKLYNLFNPTEKLQGDRLRFFVERPDSKSRKTARSLAFSDKHEKVLFVGQRGSGKSTELRYLASKTENAFFHVIIDIEEMTDIFSVNHVELLYVMGASVFAAAKAKGYDLPDKLLRELVKSIETLVKEQTGDSKFKLDLDTILKTLTLSAGVATGGTAGAAIVAVAPLFKGIKLGLGIENKEIRKLEVKPKITKICQALNVILKATEAKVGKPPFLIIDGLDRIEFSQARIIFAESQILTMPQCSTAYVIPAPLYHSPYMSLVKQSFTNHVVIPNIKLHLKGSTAPHEPGFETMRDIVRKRLAEVDLDLDQLFEKTALDLMIEKSGGLLREFINLIQDALLEASLQSADKVAVDHAQEAVDELARGYMAGLTRESIFELKKLQEDGIVSGSEVSTTLQQNMYILTQRNQELWFEVHPAIQDYVKNFEIKNTSHQSEAQS